MSKPILRRQDLSYQTNYYDNIVVKTLKATSSKTTLVIPQLVFEKITLEFTPKPIKSWSPIKRVTREPDTATEPSRTLTINQPPSSLIDKQALRTQTHKSPSLVEHSFPSPVVKESALSHVQSREKAQEVFARLQQDKITSKNGHEFSNLETQFLFEEEIEQLASSNFPISSISPLPTASGLSRTLTIKQESPSLTDKQSLRIETDRSSSFVEDVHSVPSSAVQGSTLSDAQRGEKAQDVFERRRQDKITSKKDDQFPVLATQFLFDEELEQNSIYRE